MNTRKARPLWYQNLLSHRTKSTQLLYLLCRFRCQGFKWKSLASADLVGVGPPPAVCWVLLHLAVSSAEESQCFWRLTPVWCRPFLQPVDWTAWPWSPTPSASLWAPIKIQMSDLTLAAWHFSWRYIPGAQAQWYLNFFARLGHIFQHAQPVFVLTVHH